MLLFRSLSLGLIGACFFLQLEHAQLAAPPPVQPAPIVAEVPTIIDVAGGVDGPQLPFLIHFEPGEHVSAVDDQPIASDMAAATAIVSHRGGYIDVTIASTAGSRRVLMLLH